MRKNLYSFLLTALCSMLGLNVWAQDLNSTFIDGTEYYEIGTADDLAKILQMLLDGGVYKGKRYLKAETIAMFNQRHYANLGCRRGLGFDKPLISGAPGTACFEASQSSYGHTGFTGTSLLVEPESGFWVLLLSNRVYPTRESTALFPFRRKLHKECWALFSSLDQAEG